MIKRSISLIAAAAIASSLSAQVKPGEALISAPGTVGAIGNSGHLLTYDLLTGNTTRLGGQTQYSQNRGVVLEQPDRGFWGGGGSTGHVDRFVIAGNNLTVTRWNTDAPTGGDIRDLAVVNGRVYFACWEGATQTNRLYSLPVTAPAPLKFELDLRQAGYIISIPRMTAVGNKVYIAARNRADANMTIVEFDTSTGAHKKFFERTTTIGHVETMTSSASELFLIGDVGRAFAVDVATATETRSVNIAGITGNSRPRNGVYIPESGDVLVSTRDSEAQFYVIDGPVDARTTNVGGHAPMVGDVDGFATATGALGMDYVPHQGTISNGSYHPVVPGCIGDAMRQPTGYGEGSFQFRQNMRIGVRGRASAPAFLMVGATQLNVDLTAAGAPGCFLGQDFTGLFLPIVLDPNGHADLTFQASIVPLFIQWGVFDGSNQLQISFSETRAFKAGR